MIIFIQGYPSRHHHFRLLELNLNYFETSFLLYFLNPWMETNIEPSLLCLQYVLNSENSGTDRLEHSAMWRERVQSSSSLSMSSVSIVTMLVWWLVGPSVVMSFKGCTCSKSLCIDHRLMLFALWYALCIVCTVILCILMI